MKFSRVSQASPSSPTTPDSTYGFLKNEFKRLGRRFQPNVVCTVKLSRRLFPAFPKHNLDSLIERHGLTVIERHRALDDAELIWQERPLFYALRRHASRENLIRLLHDIASAHTSYRFFPTRETDSSYLSRDIGRD